jgi:ribose 5-phosphate isomerase A
VTPDIPAEKRVAAAAAAALVEGGMRVGLGTGTTVAELVPALGRRSLAITCVATSPATEELARAHGLDVRPFTDIDRLDLAIDGADQVDPTGWLVKGGGGAQTRERIVAAAAPPTPDGGVLADFHGEVGDPALLSERLDAVPGLVSHGLFPPSMVSTVLIARGEDVEARRIS